MSATFSCFSDQKDSICMFIIKFHSVSLAVTRVRSRSREHESRIKVIQECTDLDSMSISLGSHRAVLTMVLKPLPGIVACGPELEN